LAQGVFYEHVFTVVFFVYSAVMKFDQTIELPSWLICDELRHLMSLLNKDKQYNALLVGGCVRNAVRHDPITDIDIATTLKPDEVIKECQDHHIHVIPTGLQHGTVTAVINHKHFEITTLRNDVQTDGRHAQVQFFDDWAEDAKRRDFTMNALYMTLSGQVYDPLGTGIQDAINGKIIFIGNPEKRIQEDYLRILRFFRFHAYYGHGQFDKQGLQACQKFSDKIMHLSKERITSEIFKLLSAPKPMASLKQIYKGRILGDALLFQEDILDHFITLQEQYKAPDVIARLSLFEQTLDSLLCFSNKQKKALALYRNNQPESINTLNLMKQTIYHYGNDIALQLYLLAMAQSRQMPAHDFVQLCQKWVTPPCPINGKTLIQEGIEPGKELGEILKKRTQEWLASL